MNRLLVAFFSLTCLAQPVAPALFNGLEWRFIGPFRGGRVLAVTGVANDPNTFYFGSVGGGLWKTTNGGIVWKPIFDHLPGGHRIASIGAIAVAPSDPRVLYVGTGEADMRSAISFGDGVYKSTDAGATWTHLGLADTRQIGKIVVDPADASKVYVAALGHAYGPNAERGVFKSTDGGRTWAHVLNKGAEIGAIDLAMDPADSSTLYAATWNAHRTTWSVYAPVSGPGGGLYKSTDGGATWVALTTGLPSGKWGRVGVAAAAGRRVYTLIDSDRPGLYKSDDGGATWALMSTENRTTSRAWYFSGIYPDPQNADTVFFPNVGLHKTADGGKTFSIVRGAPGGDDYHSLWIDPANSSRMILGTDQGATISPDGGASWSTWYNQPTAQVYHVVTDNATPYRVYGSQQDSGTVVLPSRTDHAVISERDFRAVGGAESGYIAPDPRDPNIVYVNNTSGTLNRFDRRTGESQLITPWPLPAFGQEISQRKYRNTWTSPLVFSEARPEALYFGTQYVLRTLDGGLHWTRFSPDLTPIGEKEAKDHGVVYTIAPSPKVAAQVWAGTDTGLIHLTRDDGKTWANVTPPGLTEWSKVTQIEASRFDPAVAYAAVDRHRLDDYNPYIYRTADYGKTWTPIVNGLAAPAFINSVRSDPVRKGLLYAATELGVAVSFDDGANWQTLDQNLPAVSVRDIVVHGNDLVVGSHGRGFWIMDDITPLRQLTGRVGTSLLKPAAGVRINNPDFSGTPLPVEIAKTANYPMGAVIDYVLEADAAVDMEILDAKQGVVRRFTSSALLPAAPGPREDSVAEVWLTKPRPAGAKAGLNRLVWDLRVDAPEGPYAMPGRYTVRLKTDGKTFTQPLEVKLDPRSNASAADLAAQFDLGLRAWTALKLTEKEAKPDRKKVAALRAVLTAVESSDRRPPEQAYEIYREAMEAK